jgi:leader peptidase (prepilin peptidase) / N-methyltransferase
MTAAPPEAALAILALVLGLSVGSFTNVVVWRLPRGASLLRPSSHCPRCGRPLRWWMNVPLASWLLLRGRCGFCRTAIPPAYPLVEALSGGLWVLMAWPGVGRLGPLPPLINLLAGGLLLLWLLPLALIDARTLRLPEPLCRWGVITGLAMTLVAVLLQPEAGWLLRGHLLACAAGLLGFEATSAVAERLLGQPALGLGDARLAALLGAWLGLGGLGVAVALAIVAGACFGVVGRLSGRLGPRQPFPFGPFLALAGVLAWLGGEALPMLLLRATVAGF